MGDPENPPIRSKTENHTVESLRLNIAEATAGRTWLLLPEGFRDQSNGETYPLPTKRTELYKLIVISIPRRKADSGCVYLRRARRTYQSHKGRIFASPGLDESTIDIERRGMRVEQAETRLRQHMIRAKAEAEKAVQEVREKAQQAVASLSDLFSLGRKGIEGQMQAHLSGQKWMSEDISAKDFRDCFRMVLQGVKGLGLPSEQRAAATDAVMQEIADSLKDTQESVALQASETDATETKH